MPTDHSTPRPPAPCRECTRALRGRLKHTGAWGMVNHPRDAELQDVVAAGYVLDPALGRVARGRVRRALRGFSLGQQVMDLVSKLAIAAAAPVLVLNWNNGAPSWPSWHLGLLVLALAGLVLVVGECRRVAAQSMSEAWVRVGPRDAQTLAEIAHLVHLDQTRGPRRDTAAIARQWRRVWMLASDQDSAYTGEAIEHSDPERVDWTKADWSRPHAGRVPRLEGVPSAVPARGDHR